MSRSPSSRAAATIALALLLATPGEPGAAAPDELVLTIPELTLQRMLDRASPIEGRTPEGLRYVVTDPRVHIRGGRILVDFSIALSGGVSLFGADIGLTLEGHLDAEIVAAIDPRTRSVKGGFHILRLSIDNLEELSDADSIKAFLNQNLTRFDYPVDVPAAEIPELGLLISAEITTVEIGEGAVRIRAHLDGRKTSPPR